MATKRYTFRLYPNKQQEQKLFIARRLHAYLYNACVAHRRYEYRANKKPITYFDQQNCLPAFKKEGVEFAYLHSQTMQATVKRVDLAYNSSFQKLRGLPKFKSIRNYSGWTYAAKSGWKVSSNGKHGTITLNDIGITIRMRGQAKSWGIPTTLTIVYKPRRNQWFASLTVDVPTVSAKFGSGLDLSYESIVAFDLGTETALTLYDGKEFTELENPRFTRKAEAKIKSNRYHVCDACGFEIPRDRGSVMVMYNVATNQQPGLGTSLADCGCSSSTSSNGKRKHTGSMRQLGHKKRQKPSGKVDGSLETPSVYTAG